jgi:predicted ATPase
MITRLKIDGFKNLVEVDVRFGPFTCIAGPNSVGKSNLFDAIRFLSDITEKTLIDAAKSVRSEGQKNSDIRDIFNKIGNKYVDKIVFEAEMIIPKTAIDHLGQTAEASITAVKYSLQLKYNDSDIGELLQIEKESLIPISLNEAKKSLYFPKNNKWTNSIITGRRGSNSPFISTIIENDQKIVCIHQDQRKGKTGKRIATQLPRTVLSTVTAEYSTACVARHEMRSWMMLQLEPSALRKSDEFDKRKSAQIQANGENLPATLYRLGTENKERDIYQELSNRLAGLIEGVCEIDIDKDDKRELLTLMLKFKNGTVFPARSLSDGTLRFLGLSVIELDSKSSGVICLEEPENGIHPQKIESMIGLLEDIATDTAYEVDENNALRQVIINTHSPVVVQLVNENSLLVAETIEQYSEELSVKYDRIIFSPLKETWRTKIINENSHPVAIGKLLSYLNPVNINSTEKKHDLHISRNIKRVIDRNDCYQLKIEF